MLAENAAASELQANATFWSGRSAALREQSTETPPVVANLALQILALAQQQGGTPTEVTERATAYQKWMKEND